MNTPFRRSIRMPSQFKSLLSQDSKALMITNSVIEWALPILEDNSTVFFPYYTDHGISHIENVLNTCHQLLPDSSRIPDAITPMDLAVLVSSGILHDFALHLSPVSFIDLIKSKNILPYSTVWFGDQVWMSHWDSYTQEIVRYDARKALALTGQTKKIKIPDINDYSMWTERDRLIVGEFIRRHHERIGHEIAVFGLSNLVNPPIGDDRLADLIGVTARSHGLDLRIVVDYVRSVFGDGSQPLGIRAPYIMGLIRVADFFQLDCKRAPVALLHMKRPASNKTLMEWEKHQAIEIVNQDESDPNALFIQVRDHEFLTHLQLKKLFKAIQIEMDHTTAVLAETYLMHPERKLRDLHLRITRLKSNLFNKEFLDRLPYVDKPASFQSGGVELLHLLSKPLYEEIPQFGARELLQNAVDAVRELEYARVHHIHNKSKSENSPIEIIFQEDMGGAYLEIIDYGVGMTFDTLRDYFLTVGASFRYSDYWSVFFTDAQGSSGPPRTGRFGIGVLAAFLLGDTLEIHTSVESTM